MKRLRRRYVLFHLHSEGKKIGERALVKAIWSNLLSIFGEVQAADSRLYMVEYDSETSVGVLQCNAALVREVVTAASLIGEIDGRPACFEPRRTAGTIKSLR
jgi:RNase P/RNase MRP subunit POP5